MDKVADNDFYQEDIESILFQKCDWSLLKRKTILISGATGLIGTVLVDMLALLNERFSLGMKLLLISRHAKSSDSDFIKYIKHDISEPINLCDTIDFIIHAASNTHPLQYAKFPVETVKTNVFGTYNLLNLALKNKKCRFLLVSSVEIYGDDTNNLKNGFSENDMGYLDCNSSRACYNESKRLSETFCAAFCAEHKIDYVSARLCRAYGATLKKDDSKALSQFLRNAINGEDIVLKSEGNQFYSYIYSVDAASALIFLLLNGKSSQSYNVADKNSNVRLKDLAAMIARKCGVKIKFDLPSEPEKKGVSKAQRAILNPQKINELGWKALFALEKGIERTLKSWGQ